MFYDFLEGRLIWFSIGFIVGPSTDLLVRLKNQDPFLRATGVVTFVMLLVLGMMPNVMRPVPTSGNVILISVDALSANHLTSKKEKN